MFLGYTQILPMNVRNVIEDRLTQIRSGHFLQCNRQGEAVPSPARDPRIINDATYASKHPFKDHSP